ncbi:MAG: phage tail tape measure protein [Sulfuritalea sp.]|jgi:TP901 family phage tail tape measure protein|nr:phage tail tape measure protein [Sulfuritalea sp.]
MADKFQLKAIISAVDKITPTLKGVQRAAKLTNKTLRDIGGAGSKLMGSLGIPAGLAFGSVVYGASRAASAVMDYAGGIQDAAERTGSSTTDFQVMSSLLEQVGGSAEDAETAMSQFNKGISNAASGADKSFAGLMKKLNISMRDTKGNVRSLSDMMPELADAFEKNTNPALRTRMSMELFGKSGSKLIPILTKGRDAYADWAKEQERLGTIVSKDAVGGLDDMGDSIGLLNKQIKSQLTQSFASLVPVIQPILRGMSEWIAANKEMIRTTITKTLTDIVNALKDVDWAAFVGGIRDAVRGIASFVEMMGGMKNVLIALGVIWLAGPVSAIFTMVGAIGRLGMGMVALMGGFGAIGSALLTVGKIFAFVGRLFLFNPIGLAITAIAAGAYLVYKNWDTIKGWFTSFFSWMDGKVTQIADWFKGMVPDWARNLLGGGGGMSFTQTTTPARTSALAMAGGRQQLNGEMTVRFENAPAGMRVEPGRTSQPGVSMNPDVGYRTLGAGFAG